MRGHWEAAQTALRVFLEEDNGYVHFLESIEQDLARKLRFHRRSGGGSLVNSVAFDRFVETAGQLRHLHALFHEKLKPLTEPPTRGDTSSVDGKCSKLVEILADMLSVLRILYRRFICRGDANQASLEIALANQATSWDKKVVEEYLEKQQLTAEKMVARPLTRFDELVEFVKALSKTLSEDDGDGCRDKDAYTSAAEKVNYARQLIHIVQGNKHYIDVTKADAREEQELIALQTCFHGDGAQALNDLSENKLLIQGEVFLSLKGQSDWNGDCSETTGSFTHLERIYAHCFQDGTFVYSKRQDSGTESFTILRRLQLKQDAAFLELIPASVPVLALLDKGHALALVLQATTVVFAWKDETERQRWADAIGGLLEINGSRTEKLHQGRMVCDLPVPEEISTQLVEGDTIPIEFASFYDDHLPGVFWMAPGKDSDQHKLRWELVEIVFYAQWLLIFKLDGWKKHSMVYHFDTHAPEVEIGEQPRGDKEWSLVISNGSAKCLTLVSKKRTRIDFWFDQIWKAIESAQVAARRAIREKRERREMEEEEAHERGDSRKLGKFVGKKRKLTVVSDKEEGLEDTKRKYPSNLCPVSSIGLKPDDETDEECGEQDRSTSRITVEEEFTAAPPVKTKSRRSCDKSKKAYTKASTEESNPVATITSPVVKTPKRKWLKKKSEDPDDTALVPTQPSPSMPNGESMCEVDTTQFPANEAAADELKSQEVRVILTGVEPTAAIRKKINLIAGAVYEENIQKATHILVPKNQLKRTVKLLCGISRCAHVLDVRWLDESARVGSPIYERAHCLKDAKAEAKWHFDMRKTMYDFTPAQRQQLFAGNRVFITNHKSVLPPVKDLVKIVECAGGTAVSKGSAGPTDIVITTETALGTASVRKALMHANPQQIYSSELILSSILQQRIDFEKNRLEQLSGSGSLRRR